MRENTKHSTVALNLANSPGKSTSSSNGNFEALARFSYLIPENGTSSNTDLRYSMVPCLLLIFAMLSSFAVASVKTDLTHLCAAFDFY